MYEGSKIQLLKMSRHEFGYSLGINWGTTLDYVVGVGLNYATW